MMPDYGDNRDSAQPVQPGKMPKPQIGLMVADHGWQSFLAPGIAICSLVPLSDFAL